MSILVDLTEEQLAELQEVTEQSDPAAAIRIAVAEHIRFVRRRELTELPGRVEIQEGWIDLDSAELDDESSQTRPD